MKTALELIGKDAAARCHESIVPLLELVAFHARVEMRALAATRARVTAACAIDAGEIPAAIMQLPVDNGVDTAYVMSTPSAIAAMRVERAANEAEEVPERKHAHYFKATPFAEVDVYRVLLLFGVTDPCLQHALKKLLVAGGRGAGKDIRQDVAEAVDTLVRWQEMRAEEGAA